MKKELTNIYPALQTVTLKRVTLVHQSIISASMLKYITKPDARMQLLAEEDAFARRTILRAFGDTKVYEVKTPKTWWQHLKLALRTRWPKLFKRLRVELLVQTIDTGYVLSGLPSPILGDRLVIPYHTGPNVPMMRIDSLIDDESDGY